jgi:hypothetical protein
MKLSDLLSEMPIFKNTEMPPMELLQPFYSMNTLHREFDFIGKGQTRDNEEFWVVIKKNHNFAVIGVPGTRERDGREGMNIYGEIEFKTNLLISGLNKIVAGKNVVQVNVVGISEKYRHMGFGFYLYLTLAKAGFVVISDNTQYIGGKELWKSIASTVCNSYVVYVIDNGVVRVNLDGTPVVYDGHNIDDAELWSTDSSRKYTLFALIC